MSNIDLLTDNNILKMKVTEAADFCDYTDIKKFQFDFYMKYGMPYFQKKTELKKKFIYENHNKLSDTEMADILGVSQSAISQMRSMLGLTKRKFNKKSMVISNKFISMNEYIQKRKIKATILNKRPLPKKFKIKIKQIDSCRCQFFVVYGKKKYIEGEYSDPAFLSNARAEIEDFLRRIKRRD